jgi:aminomethyltransferase
MIALQGPRAIELLQHRVPVDMDTVPRFTAVETTIGETPALIGRTGYTGEDGVEIFFPVDAADQVWTGILATGQEHGIEIAPIGLAARDSLRCEPAFALYGHEIDDDITPLEARLGWACKLNKHFIGRDALVKQKEEGLTRKIVAFELTGKGVPRHEYPVTNTTGEEIGIVVTGLYAPTVEKYCGNALISSAYAKIGTELQIIIRGKPKAAVVVKRPFYTPAYR